MPGSEALSRAAELAEQGRFRVEPNPCVGCVIVRNGKTVGEGFHAYWGGPHAEVAALRAAGEKAKGATVYVTLEPCAHKGKTAACTDALIRAGVAEVVYAHPDPNPRTAGVGPAQLREAGIKVRQARASAAVQALLEPSTRMLRVKKPWVIAKWAMTLDGCIATRDGDSKWVSSARSRKWAQKNLRSTIDAILVGAGTALRDNPVLTNRSGRGRQPLRVVVCGQRRLPPKLRLLTDGGRTLLAIPDNFRRPEGAETLVCGPNWRVDPRRMLRQLRKRGFQRVLIEGGSELLGSLFDARLVDQVAVFVAPRVVGGISAVKPVAGLGRARMRNALEFSRAEWRELDGDRLLEGYLA